MFSKSQYIKFINCPKQFWLYKNKYNEQTAPSDFQQHLFDQGKEVGAYAYKYFPQGVLVENGWQNPKAALAKTQELLPKQNYIYEAAFEYNNLIVFVDILEKNKDGSYNIIEVKSGTKVEDSHYDDLSVQKYVLDNCGLKIHACYLMHLNPDYEKTTEEIDIKNLFVLENLTHKLKPSAEIEENLKQMAVLAKGPEPQNVLKVKGTCDKCPFKDYCWADLPKISIFNIPRIGMKAEMLQEDGILDVKQIPPNYFSSFTKNKWVEVFKTGKPYVNSKAISTWLKNLKYPLYYFDFETINFAIPHFKNSKPYSHIAFQFSLHIQNESHGPLEHKEFLFEGKEDPRYACIEAIKKFIGPEGSIIAHYATFESTILKDLAQLPISPQDRDFLLSLRERLEDTCEVFSKYYFHPDFGGSASIKKVLPVVCPSMTYEGMPVAHGGDAMNAFMLLYFDKLPQEEAKKLRADLLAYCYQDTLAMVKLIDFLYTCV